MSYTHAASEAQAHEITALRAGRPSPRAEDVPEGLHWALRTSFLALVSPRAWRDALFPERAVSGK